jgi:uncharacterized membrane protein YfcA
VLDTVLTLPFLIAVAVAVLAGLVRGFSGFGAALILAPGFTLVMPAREAVAMTVLLNAATATQLLLPALRVARWREIGPMAAASVSMIPFGSLLLIGLEGAIIRRGIGVIVLGFSLVMLAGWRYRGGRTLARNLIVGALGGGLTGAASIGGPPIILYFLAGDRSMAENRAGFICFFAITQISALPVFLWEGLVTWDLVGAAALILPAYLLATYAGAHLFTRASETFARRFALTILVLIGAATLIR